MSLCVLLKMAFILDENKLIRYLNNLSSQKEKEEVSSWLDQPGAKQELEEMLQNRWGKTLVEDSQKEVEYRMLLGKIHHATIGKEKPKKALGVKRELVKMERIAATYFLLLFSAYTLYQWWKPMDPEPLAEEVSVQVIERKTAAGEKLRITLPDQSKVIVNSL